MDSISSRAKSAVKWTVGLRFTSQIFTWLSSILVIRFLTPSDYGIVAIAEIITMLTILFAIANLDDSIIKQKNLSEPFIRQILAILVLLSILFIFLQICFAHKIAIFYDLPILKYILYVSASVFIVTPWFAISSGLLAKELNFKRRSQIDFGAALICSAIALTMAYLGFGFWALIISNITLMFIRAIGYTIALKRFYLPLFKFDGLLPALKFGLTIMSAGFVFMLFMKIDIFIAGKFIDAHQLGFYAVAMHLALMLMTKAMPLINEVAFPMFASLQDDKEKYQQVFYYMLRIITLFCFPLFYGFAATANDLVILVLGEQWQQAVLPLQIILLTIPLRLISNLFMPLMKALGYPSTELIHNIFSLSLTAIAVYVTASHGIVAIALAWLVITPFYFLFAVYLNASKAGLKSLTIIKSVLPPLLLSFIMLAALYALQHFYLSNFSMALRLFIMVLAGIGIYVIALWVLFKKRFEEALSFRL